MQISRVTSHIIGAERNFLFVVVETDTGLVGVGEGGMTWREGATAGFIDALRPLLLGADPFRTEHLWQVMFRSGFFPPGRVGAAALSAVDIALWDLKAQALGVPLYQLLGGLCRDQVACYPHARGQSTAQLVDHARQLVAEGYRFIRTEIRGGADGSVFEPRHALREAIADLRALRTALGDSIELLIDVHTRLDPADALLFCKLAEEFQPYFVEDPLRCENPDSYRRLAARTTVPLAVGEQYSSKWEFRSLIEDELCDFARIDVCLAGGLTETLKINSWCETHGLKLALHNPLGPVSTAACLHLDLASSCFGVQELPRTPGTYLQDLFPVQVPYSRGHLQPPTRPGLGVVIDESRVQHYPPSPRGGALCGGERMVHSPTGSGFATERDPVGESLSRLNQHWFEFVTRGESGAHATLFAPLGLLLGWLVIRWSTRLVSRERGTPWRMGRAHQGLILLSCMALTALLPIAVIAGRCQSLVEGGSIDWAQWRILYHLGLVTLLFVATVVDLDQYVIPDEITLTGTVLGVVGAFAISNMQLIPVWVDWNHWAPDVGPEIPTWIKTSHHWHGLVWSLTGMVVGAGLTWLARIVSEWALGLEALGLGDVTLMAMIGSFLGWQPVVCVFLIAPLCGVVVALLLRFSQGRRALPYGPCLACAAVVVLFTWRAIWERTRELFGHPPTLAGLAILIIGGMTALLGIVRLYRSIPVAQRRRSPDTPPSPADSPLTDNPESETAS